MPEQHRATFETWRRPRFQYLECLEDRKSCISTALSGLDGRSGHILLRALQQARGGHFEDRFTLFTMRFKGSLPRRPEDLEFWSSTSVKPSERDLTPYYWCYRGGRAIDGAVLELERHQHRHVVEPAAFGFPVYGEDRSNLDDLSRWVAYDPPDSELLDRVHRLPQEIVDHIHMLLLDATMGRREALLEHQSLYPHIFRAMSRADYLRYSLTWISNALWVLSPRTYRVLLCLFRDQVYEKIHPNLQYQVRQLIVRLDDSFSCRRCIEEVEAYFDLGSYPMWKDESRTVPKDMFEVAWEHNQKAMHAQENTLRAWRTALKTATYFDLQHLTLDFTHTYGLDGCWLGLEVFHGRRLMRFHTEQLIIKAPDKSKEELIWREVMYARL